MSVRDIPFLSSPCTDNQSMASGSRSHYSRDHHSSGGSDRDIDVDDDWLHFVVGCAGEDDV